MFNTRQVCVAACALIISAMQLSGQSIAAPVEESATAAAGDTPTKLPLPAPYESLIVSLGALASSAEAEQKAGRAGTRLALIRTALTEKLLDKSLGSSVIIDGNGANTALSAKAMLCGVRKDYVVGNLDVNYLSSLVSQLTEISKPAPKPDDLISAIKLMLANSSFKVSARSKGEAEDKIKEQMDIICNGDLKEFDKAYYGTDIKFAGEVFQEEAADEALIPLTFLGPFGTLASAILAIIEPIFIDASTIIDEQKREAEIIKALNDDRPKIESYSKNLALALDKFASTQRRNLAGQFNETLVQIQSQAIDLSKEDSCHKMADAKRLPDGEPSMQFVKCWRTAWLQVQPMVTSLVKTGDDYDALADVGVQKSSGQLDTILKAYQQISSGSYVPTDAFWDDITQFIGLVSAIKSAASASNLKNVENDLNAAKK
jgi:hypothetical protein